MYIARGLKNTELLSLAPQTQSGPLLKVPAKPGDFASPPAPTWA